jgi:DNA-binding NarL/FixJ family response regulator
VLYALDGITGLESAIQHNPDLLLMDINMPGKSGLDVLEELKEQGYTIPAIVMTSYGSEKNILKALRLGAKEFIQKPFSRFEVLEAVEKTLAEARWQRERFQMNQALAGANRQIQEQLSAWANLNVIGQAIASAMGDAEVQRRLMWGVNELLRAEHGSLYLLDEEKSDLVLQFSLQGMLESKGGRRIKLGQGIAGWVAQHNRSVLIEDLQHEQRFYEQSDRESGMIAHSVLAAPLTVKERVLGVIQITNPIGNKKQFDQADLELLEALAALVAVAVENGRLYAKLRGAVSLESFSNSAKTLAQLLHRALSSLRTNLKSIQESLQGEIVCPPELLERVTSCQKDIAEITAVLRVIEHIPHMQIEPHQDSDRTLDLDSVLRQEIERLKSSSRIDEPLP